MHTLGPVLRSVSWWFILSAVLFISCMDETGRTSNEGRLSLELVSDTALMPNQTRASSLSELNSFANTADYAVEILQGTTSIQKFERYDKMSDEIALKAGDYTIQVSKGKNEAAAFSSPYFTGKQNFKIAEGMTTPVTVTASLANSRVTVDLTDDFLETYPKYTLSFMTNKMKTPLVYETGKPMYFQADAAGTKLTIAMQLINVYGKEVEYTATTNIKPKQWAALTVRTDEKGINGLAVDVTLNDGTNETVYVNIGIPDFMEKLKGAPWVENEMFNWTENDTIDTPYVLEPAKMGAIAETAVPVDITAGGKISEFNISIAKGNEIIDSYDLANLSEAQQQNLKDKYNLEVNPKEIKGQIGYMIDLKPLLNSLIGGQGTTEYLITLSVKDALPKQHETLRYLKVQIKEVKAPYILLLKDEEFKEGESSVKNIMMGVAGGIKQLTFKIPELNINEDFTNGSTINDITYTPPTGSSTPKIVLTKEWLNNLTVGEYTVIVEIEDKAGQMLTENNSFKITVTPPTFEWAMADNDGDVFAKYAYLRVKANNADKVTFYQNGTQIPSTDLVPLGRDNDGIVTYVWKGLAPNTSYSGITAKYNEMYELSAKSFMTEAIEILPNNEFSKWNVSMKYVGGTLKKAYTPFFTAEQWSTNNEQTAISLSGLGGSIPSANTSYRSFSAVTFDNSSVSVRAIGYGGYSSDLSSQYSTSGILWLYDGNNEGYTISSRPKSINVYCNMETKNSEVGKVEISIIDENNEVISSIDSEIKQGSNLEQPLNIPLQYTKNVKASRIKMKFYASTSDSPSLDATTITVPTPDGNQSYGVRAGNTLTIDKVELIYDYKE